jgi:alkylresorcinol/alkylpyrone synthase
VATAVPETVLTQAEATEIARRLFGRQVGLFDALAGVFKNAGIAKRHVVRPTTW